VIGVTSPGGHKASRPRPKLERDTKGYWEALRNHQLVIQRCLECQAFRHHPRPMCPECHSLNFEWAPVSGRGTVYSYSIVTQLLHPYWADRIPYNVVLVELEEGIRIVSSLVDCPNQSIQIGMPVTVVFEDVSEEISLPMFKPLRPD
jgi:uncharacterized OB-fold protein